MSVNKVLRIQAIRQRMEARMYRSDHLTPNWQGGVKRMMERLTKQDMAHIHAICFDEAREEALS